MNTEKTKKFAGDIDSLIGDFPVPPPPRFYSVLQFSEIRGRLGLEFRVYAARCLHTAGTA